MMQIGELANLSGVSVRTLHHYDRIGLLRPTGTGANGYRYYDRAAQLRLQQILFYRQIGMPLAEIAVTLDDPAFDMASALSTHRERLVREGRRVEVLIATIDATLNEIKGNSMPIENPFKGFTPAKQAAYEAELIDSRGEVARAHIVESKAKMARRSLAEQQAIVEEGHQINLDLIGLLKSGHHVESDAVQAAVKRHHAWVSHYWTPNAEAYAGLADNYAGHADFRAFYDRYDIALVDFLAAAMKVFAKRSLQ